MNLDSARALDADDPLATYREQFHVPRTTAGHDCVYFCGNSLGLQPKCAADFVNAELRDWREYGVEGHFQAERPWMPYHRRLAPHLAALVGATETEVVAMNTLTVNLHLLMVSFFRPTRTRNKILIEAGAFPSDRFAMRSQLSFHGLDPDACLIELAPREGETALRMEDIAQGIESHGDTLALIMLPGVQYYSGQLLDMAGICELGRANGCVVGFDLAHAVGNVPLSLHDWGADFAVWCSYKYLNAGPGAVGGAFVHARHATRNDLPRFSGWWGHDEATRFEMGPDFVPMPGAEGWQLSNPPSCRWRRYSHRSKCSAPPAPMRCVRSR